MDDFLSRRDLLSSDEDGEDITKGSEDESSDEDEEMYSPDEDDSLSEEI